jgi:hypothetical protein
MARRHVSSDRKFAATSSLIFPVESIFSRVDWILRVPTNYTLDAQVALQGQNE